MSVNKWIIKNSEGQIIGPYTTEQVMDLIQEFVLTGEEQISPFPGSKWIPISQDPSFYDQLLEALSGEKNISHGEEPPRPTSDLDDDQTPPPEDQWDLSASVEAQSFHPEGDVVEPSTTQKRAQTQTSTTHEPTGTSSKTPFESSAWEKVKEGQAKTTQSEEGPPQQATIYDEEDSDQEVIELEDQKKIDKKAKKKAVYKPMVALITVLLLFVTWLFWPQEPVSTGVKLLFPKKGLKPLDEKEVQRWIQSGELHFILDTFDGYTKAQTYFTKALEGNLRSDKSWAMLCLTYLELWPFVKQDSRDLKVITEAERLALAADAIGPNGSTCRAVNLLIQGRMVELKSVIRDILERYGAQSPPPLAYYYLKAKQLELENQLSASVGYLESVQKIWPSWLRPFAMSAALYQKMGRFNEAATLYQGLLKANPNHVVSQIELGIIEYKNFNHVDQGYKRIQQALNSGLRANNTELARAHYYLAEILLRYKDNEKARQHIAKAFTLNPADPIIKNLAMQLGSNKLVSKNEIDVRQLISEGDQYYREGNWEEAQAHYKTAYELDNKNAIAALKAAKSLWSLSFSEEAILWLNRAIQADYKLIQAYILLADYHAQRFDFLTAGRVLQQANKVAPRSYEVFRGFAQVELTRKNPQAAISFAEKAIQLYNMDIDSYIITTRAYMMLGARGDNYQNAYTSAVKAVEIDSNNREAQVVYAKAMAGLKGVELGVHYLTNLVNRFPEIMEYRMALGEILFEDQRYQEAAKAFREVVDIQPKYKRAYIELGRVYKALMSYDYALRSFLSASRLDPGDAVPTYESGLLYLETKKLSEAHRQFERVLEINEKYPLAHYYLGEVALARGDYKEAIIQANKEKSKNPNLPEPYLLAARAYIGSRQYSLCAREYQQAIQLSTLSSNSYVNVAMCYRLSGNFDAAETMVVKAEKIENGNPLVYKEQGAIFESKGNNQLAARAYQQYLVLSPNAPDKKMIEIKIQSLNSQ